jgi:hypothetical protein
MIVVGRRALPALDLDPAFISIDADAAKWWTPAFPRDVHPMFRHTAPLTMGELRAVWIRYCFDVAFAFDTRRCVESLFVRN